MLKTAFADLLPPSILTRPKQPYRSPDATAFFGGGSPEWVDDVMDPAAVTAAGIFDPGAVGALLAKCRRKQGRGMGNTDNMRALAMLSTQLIHRQFIVEDGAPEGDLPLPEPFTLIDHATHR